MQKFIKCYVVPVFLFLPLLACATDTTIDKLLSSTTEPAGVIIEIVTADSQGLSWALPQARQYIKKLRQRFPGIPIAIVTHGQEQFALQSKQAQRKNKIHSLARALRKDDVQLHVCGTFAGWRGLAKEDFPDYVDVAPAGPSQVNDYLALEYQLVIIKQRNK